MGGIGRRKGVGETLDFPVKEGRRLRRQFGTVGAESAGRYYRPSSEIPHEGTTWREILGNQDATIKTMNRGFIVPLVLFAGFALAVVGGIAYVHYIYLPRQNAPIPQSFVPSSESPTLPSQTSSLSPSPDITIQLQINGSSVNSVTLKTGEEAAITWNTKNASQCFSEGGGLNTWPSQERPISGKFSMGNIGAIGKSQFTLVCKNGSKTQSATVALDVVSSLSNLPQTSPPQSTVPPAQIAPPSSSQPKQKILEKFATMIYKGSLQSPVTIDSAGVIKKFYETHPDIYDFIVIYSAIPTNAQAASGLTVKNGIRGNGSFYPDLDETAKYGSNGKLLGSIFMPPSLGLDASANIDLLRILSHEVAHHWIMYIGDIADCESNPNISVKCAKTPTGLRVNEDGGHWNTNVNTAVLENGLLFEDPNTHGFKFAWQMNADGYCSTVAATGSGFRFNDIDLYLMGFISPSEAKPLFWYDLDSEFNEKLGGQKCVQHTLGVQDIVNTEGVRQPAYPTAQRDFKMGFILLTAPGQNATQQQISKMNYIVDNFSAAWNEATRKTSTMNIPL